MNPMDQAFIKAYAKDKPSARSAPTGDTAPAPQATGPIPDPHGFGPSYVPQQQPPVYQQPYPPHAQWNSGATAYRVEPSVDAWGQPTPRPHVAFPPAGAAYPQPGQYPDYPQNAVVPAAYPPPGYPSGPFAAPNHGPSGHAKPFPPSGYPMPLTPAANTPAANPTAPNAVASWSTVDTSSMDLEELARTYLGQASAPPTVEPDEEKEPPRRSRIRIDRPRAPRAPKLEATPNESVDKFVPMTPEAAAAAPQAISAPPPAQRSVTAEPSLLRTDEAHGAIAAPHFAEARESREKAGPEDHTAPQSVSNAFSAEATSTIPADDVTSPLLAVWEVDRFQWPEAATKLLREYAYFGQSGKKLKAAAEQGLKTLGVTGLGRGEGRSLLTMCLALSAAREGLNVALIDADFAKPDLALALGLEASVGWRDAIEGKLALVETGIHSVSDKLTLLPLIGEAAGVTLDDRRVHAIIQEAAKLYDVVLLDLGPLPDGAGDRAGASFARPPVDAAIVVCDLRRRTLAEARRAAAALQASGVDAVGIAENFSAP